MKFIRESKHIVRCERTWWDDVAPIVEILFAGCLWGITVLLIAYGLGFYN